jgi:hypothetical protein
MAYIGATIFHIVLLVQRNLRLTLLGRTQGMDFFSL